MAKNNPPRAVLDSNILISAYVFGGQPKNVLKTVISEEVIGITSDVLITEFLEVLRKKFDVSQFDMLKTKEEIESLFEIVYPIKTFNVVKDESDNRVLEAAVEGNCNFIVTGDKELLTLKIFKGIKILTASEFLAELNPKTN